MGIFGKSKVKTDWTIPHTDYCDDGYTRIKLATYQDKYAYEGLRGLGSRPIKTVSFAFRKTPDGIPMMNVYANERYQIGTLWRDNYSDIQQLIRSGKVRSAHVDIVDRDEVYLYIK